MMVTAGLAETVSSAVYLTNNTSITTVTPTTTTAAPTQLSVARRSLAATSVGNVAIFAGGETGNCSFTLFVEGLLFG